MHYESNMVRFHWISKEQLDCSVTNFTESRRSAALLGFLSRIYYKPIGNDSSEIRTGRFNLGMRLKVKKNARDEPTLWKFEISLRLELFPPPAARPTLNNVTIYHYYKKSLPLEIFAGFLPSSDVPLCVFYSLQGSAPKLASPAESDNQGGRSIIIRSGGGFAMHFHGSSVSGTPRRWWTSDWTCRSTTPKWNPWRICRTLIPASPISLTNCDMFIM